MKEKMIYVAVDADDIGEIVGNAILSNDSNKLASVSGKINAGIQVFSRWAEYNGGEVISSGSDEAIFRIPSTSSEELEAVKNKYQEKTGFSVSIGTGEKISDAAKALIYAKANGKDQIVEYSSSIEDALKQSMEDGSSKEDQKLVGGIGDETKEEDVDEEQFETGADVEKEHTSDEDEAEEIALDHLTEDPVYYSKLAEMEGSDKKPEKSEEEDSEEEDSEEEDSEEKEGSQEEEKVFDSEEDLDVDGRPDVEEEHGKISLEDDLDGDGDIEHEEAVAADSGEKYDDTQDEEDEYLDENEDSISDAIEQEMSSEDTEEMPEETPEEMSSEDTEEMPEEGAEEIPEEMPEEGAEEIPEEGAEEIPEETEVVSEEISEEELKQAIYDSLQIFKQNKDFLNALAQENPDLHNALVVSLQSMIEMSKELGYGQENDMNEQEMEDDLNPDDFLVSDESEDLDQPEDVVEKNELVYKMMEKISKSIQTSGLTKKETLEKLKQKMKEKIHSKIMNAKKSKSKKKFDDGLKKKPKPKKVDSSSFCATSNTKMKTSGKDCRSAEDKNSPLCAARKKNNCRGKNAEKGMSVQKSEKLKSFLGKQRKK